MVFGVGLFFFWGPTPRFVFFSQGDAFGMEKQKKMKGTLSESEEF